MPAKSSAQPANGEAEMNPFKPNSAWYVQYWYSNEAKYPWHVPVALASLAALFVAVWTG
jgi:hypothetical protein